MTEKGPAINNENNMEGRPMRAYKRSPALPNSTWYKGILCSHMAGTADNGGAFDIVISRMRRGTEPPPHVHSREDEFFYVLSGEMRVYAEGESISAGRGRMHVSSPPNAPCVPDYV
jgi:mannose-6-phosphate isomerase-like protein (cupin superfamily)